MAKLRKKGITLLKIVVSAALLYFIFTKIPFKEVWTELQTVRPLYLIGALVLFVISKVVAAFRLNLYFHKINIPLSTKTNFRLYLLGMFYNLFLPGGIGGDAYKGYYLKQHFEVKTKRVVAVLLLDRLSGLLLLFVLACALGMTLDAEEISSFQWLFALCIPLSILVFRVLYARFFAYVLGIFWKTNLLSALVQLAQLGTVLFILGALDINVATSEYLFIFLISSIVSVIPLTVGGIGSRELVFLYGALWLGLEEDRSIGISMIFFMITALVSLAGFWYHFKKPVPETR
ncbi:lysylphosphatidylglycerol synthase transmembrane domain-containing protein [Muriicola soli]|uniref:Flippase-like domain-containing protein n=1 Tax=Muriicola soli TaxID=2507538 RepID=A0A411EAD7_9FLAO|nr:lysylphosphatidylglycerol synthase transmembrane domain-containing protein [Muriicola soli]QBA64629.1 flippase-like domain-containing protein [Muriicola soli]